tara:strand:+ start:323 stop:730 length:408 start_codon:yes stop_codon:yes gene_type:complete
MLSVRPMIGPISLEGLPFYYVFIFRAKIMFLCRSYVMFLVYKFYLPQITISNNQLKDWIKISKNPFIGVVKKVQTEVSGYKEFLVFSTPYFISTSGGITILPLFLPSISSLIIFFTDFTFLNMSPTNALFGTYLK